jgi:hypothetical protein
MSDEALDALTGRSFSSLPLTEIVVLSDLQLNLGWLLSTIKKANYDQENHIRRTNRRRPSCP